MTRNAGERTRRRSGSGLKRGAENVLTLSIEEENVIDDDDIVITGGGEGFHDPTSKPINTAILSAKEPPNHTQVTVLTAGARREASVAAAAARPWRRRRSSSSASWSWRRRDAARSSRWRRQRPPYRIVSWASRHCSHTKSQKNSPILLLGTASTPAITETDYLQTPFFFFRHIPKSPLKWRA